MGTVIAVTNQKGGVGKSTTSLALAAELGHRKHRVLLIDLDAQSNSTVGSGFDKYNLKASTYNLLTSDREQRCDLKYALLKTKYYDLLPSDNDTDMLNYEMRSYGELRKVLRKTQDEYDFIILDCPPALSRVTCNAWVAADYIVIPLEPAEFSEIGLKDLNIRLEEIRPENPDLKVAGILLTKYQRNTKIAKETWDRLQAFATEHKTQLFRHTIRASVAVKNSQQEHIPLCDYRPISDVYKDYKGFVTELLQMMEG